MSLLPRRFSSAVWAIKQHEPSCFCFITTACRHFLQLSLCSLQVFYFVVTDLPISLSTAVMIAVELNGNFAHLPLLWWTQKHTIHIQTTCNNAYRGEQADTKLEEQNWVEFTEQSFIFDAYNNKKSLSNSSRQMFPNVLIQGGHHSHHL